MKMFEGKISFIEISITAFLLFTPSVSVNGQWNKQNNGVTVDSESIRNQNNVDIPDFNGRGYDISFDSSESVGINADLYQDSLALVALYNSTNGANWTNNTNWMSTNPLFL